MESDDERSTAFTTFMTGFVKVFCLGCCAFGVATVLYLIVEVGK